MDASQIIVLAGSILTFTVGVLTLYMSRKKIDAETIKVAAETDFIPLTASNETLSIILSALVPLKAEIKDLHNEIGLLKTTNKELCSEISDLKIENEKLRDENHKLSVSISRLRAALENK